LPDFNKLLPSFLEQVKYVPVSVNHKQKAKSWPYHEGVYLRQQVLVFFFYCLPLVDPHFSQNEKNELGYTTSSNLVTEK
jgi:hypothetical protein